MRNRLCAFERLAVKHRSQNLVELIRGNAAYRRFPIDQLFANHFARDADCRNARALAVTRLKHKDFGIFNRKFKVLHIAEVVFQRFADREQLLVCRRHDGGEAGDGIRRADSGDNVFTLRVHQKFTVENLFAACGVARKRNARTGLVARVPEDHRLHVNRRAPVGRNVIFLAVDDSAFVHP